MSTEKLICKHCNTTTDIGLEDSRVDNETLPLCRKCASEHHQFWDELLPTQLVMSCVHNGRREWVVSYRRWVA